MDQVIKKLRGGNLDIDLATPEGDIPWKQDACPWNTAEHSDQHKCAIKNVSICPYFCGIEFLDTVLCCYPQENPFRE
jgi:hypothetical protein